VSDGVAALRFVRREAPYQEAPRPGLMLLDLDLPGMDGLDVLGELVRDELLRDIAVVVLTASDVEADRFRGLRLGAAAYLTKPVDFTSLVDIVCTVDEMHFSVVRGHADS
jgi:DNA-binding response OmpR family regulator